MSTEDLRSKYVDALARMHKGNMTDADQRAVLDEVEQFLVDMMDVCEQTLLAEPAIIAAHDALKAKRADIELLKNAAAADLARFERITVGKKYFASHIGDRGGTVVVLSKKLDDSREAGFRTVVVVEVLETDGGIVPWRVGQEFTIHPSNLYDSRAERR